MTAIVCSCVAFYFVDPILNWMARPVGEFVYTAPTEAFFIHLKIALCVGGVFTFPVCVYQLWQFIGRALNIKERAIILQILPFGIVLFFIGAALALFVVVPAAMRFLMGFSSPTLKPMISLDAYLSFVFWMIIGFGVFFQLPLVVITLSRFGIVSPNTLAKYRRHVIVGIFLVAAALTPGPDIVSQFVMAVPTYLLFEISLVIGRRLAKPNEPK